MICKKTALLPLLLFLLLLINCSDTTPSGKDPDTTNTQPVNPAQGVSGFLNAQEDSFIKHPELACNLEPYFTWIYPATTSGHMVVSWGRTNLHKAVFYLGNSPGDSSLGVYTNSFERKHASFVCDGLTPGAQYFFKIEDTTGTVLAPETTFRTAPATGSPFTFFINSDMQPLSVDPYDLTAIQAVVTAMTNSPDFSTASFIVNVGDRVAHGRAADWHAWVNDYWRPILNRLPVVPSTGNHDYDQYNTSIGYTNSYFTDIFSLPGKEWYYTLDIGKCRFVVLDTGYLNDAGMIDSLSFRGGQYQFYGSTLAKAAMDKANGTIDFIFLVFHNCIASTGYHGNDTYINTMRSEMGSQISYYNVDMVFNGHDHTCQRNIWNGTPFIVTGTGGGYNNGANGSIHPENAPAGLVNQFFTSQLGYHLVTVNQKQLQLSFRDTTGTTLDSTLYRQKTLYYHNPRNWLDVYVHFANHHLDGQPIWHPYPGRRMTALGNGWFSCSILVQENPLHQFELICNFNNGSDAMDNNYGQDYHLLADEQYVEGTNPQGPDLPEVTISSPVNNTTISGTMHSSAFLSISGTATASAGDTVSEVQLSVNGGTFTAVTGTTTWAMAGIPLLWNTLNTLQARVITGNGKTNMSALCFVNHVFSPAITLDGIMESRWNSAATTPDPGDAPGSVPTLVSGFDLTSFRLTNDGLYLYLGFPVSTELPGRTAWILGISTNTTTGGTNTRLNFNTDIATNTWFSGSSLPDYLVFLKYGETDNSYLDSLEIRDSSGAIVHQFDSQQGLVNHGSQWAEVRIPLDKCGLAPDSEPEFWLAVTRYSSGDAPLFDSIPALFAEPSIYLTAFQEATGTGFTYRIR